MFRKREKLGYIGETLAKARQSRGKELTMDSTSLLEAITAIVQEREQMIEKSKTTNRELQHVDCVRESAILAFEKIRKLILQNL